jgi:AMMECR1 domain-containing protein
VGTDGADDRWLMVLLSSAFEDHRFRPIQANEISGLTCGVSLLTHFEPLRVYNDWQVCDWCACDGV